MKRHDGTFLRLGVQKSDSRNQPNDAATPTLRNGRVQLLSGHLDCFNGARSVATSHKRPHKQRNTGLWNCLRAVRLDYCPACRTSLIATRFWVVMICPIIKCLTVLEFSFILFDLCLFITIFNFILNHIPIVTFWIFTYHKIWILLIIFCFIWSYWIIYSLTCLEVFRSVVS